MSSAVAAANGQDAALAETAHLYERVKRVMPPVEWAVHAPAVAAINRLKRDRQAVVLAHNYQTPEIYHGVADIVGDSLALARRAAETEAEVIVMAGVHFMAETVKLLNPGKTVLIPDVRAGCSLAASITGADVRRLRVRHPGVPVVTYVNTSAEVKAEADICCTSGNAVAIVESLGSDRVIFIPDEYLASYVAGQTAVEVIPWRGRCEVHERFTGDDVRRYRNGFDRLAVIAHPECPPTVLDGADDRLRQGRAAAAGADADRVLDERQRGGGNRRRRVRAAVQPVPAHEAHHAGEDPAGAGDPGTGGRRAGGRGPGRAPRRGTDAGGAVTGGAGAGATLPSSSRKRRSPAVGARKAARDPRFREDDDDNGSQAVCHCHRERGDAVQGRRPTALGASQ